MFHAIFTKLLREFTVIFLMFFGRYFLTDIGSKSFMYNSVFAYFKKNKKIESHRIVTNFIFALKCQ